MPNIHRLLRAIERAGLVAMLAATVAGAVTVLPELDGPGRGAPAGPTADGETRTA